MNTQAIAALDRLDEARIFGLEHQLHLLSVMGPAPSWSYTFPDQVTLRGRTSLTCPAQILGTVTDDVWRWGWDDTRLPPAVTTAARQVRAAGTARWMVEPRIPVRGDRDAQDIATLAKSHTGMWTTFSFSPRRGWTVYAALTHPRLILPAPNETTTAQTLAVAVELVTDIHAAVEAYAGLRGLQSVHYADSVAVGRDGWRVTVRLGEPAPTLHVESA